MYEPQYKIEPDLNNNEYRLYKRPNLDSKSWDFVRADPDRRKLEEDILLEVRQSEMYNTVYYNRFGTKIDY